MVTVWFVYDIGMMKSDWEPGEKSVGEITDNRIAAVRAGPTETELQKKVRNAGGKWDRNMKLRIIGYREFSELGLDDRFVKVVN